MIQQLGPEYKGRGHDFLLSMATLEEIVPKLGVHIRVTWCPVSPPKVVMYLVWAQYEHWEFQELPDDSDVG